MATTETPDREQRPSPEALLRQAAREGQGRLKIFLGAAPGVGKTYKMLCAAQTAREEGVDVVVGIVETHGRAETQALASHSPAVAPRPRAHPDRRWRRSPMVTPDTPAHLPLW